jgi:hypothetical protein
MADYSLSEITTEIAAAVNKELDEPFKRMMVPKVDAWRGTLIRRTLKENPGERVHFRQTLYVPLVESSPVPECKDPDQVLCTVMQTTLAIPASVRAGDIQYDYVGSIDGNTPFRRKDPGIGNVLKNGKYSKSIILWEEIARYINIEGAIGLKMIRIDGVFDKPSEIAQFNCESGQGGCDFWNEPYPVTSDIRQAIVECILKVDFGLGNTVSDKDIEVTPQKQQHEPDGR